MNRTLCIAAFATALAVTLTGCQNDPNAAPVHQGHQGQSAAQPSATPTPVGAIEAHPNKQNLKMNLRVTSKQCFGSVGCLIEYAVAPVWTGTPGVKLDGDYDLTYKVTGDDSGPILETMRLYSNGKYEVPFMDGTMSTSSGAVHPTVTITRIRKHVGY